MAQNTQPKRDFQLDISTLSIAGSVVALLSYLLQFFLTDQSSPDTFFKFSIFAVVLGIIDGIALRFSIAGYDVRNNRKKDVKIMKFLIYSLLVLYFLYLLFYFTCLFGGFEYDSQKRQYIATSILEQHEFLKGFCVPIDAILLFNVVRGVILLVISVMRLNYHNKSANYKGDN